MIYSTVFFYSTTTQGNKGPSRQSLWANIDTNMTTNIQKLFSEKVEIFGPVELHKSDIMMAVVKICLRVITLLCKLELFTTTNSYAFSSYVGTFRKCTTENNVKIWTTPNSS